MKEKLNQIKDAIKTLKAVKKEIKLSKQYEDDLKITVSHGESTISIKIKEGWTQSV